MTRERERVGVQVTPPRLAGRLHIRRDRVPLSGSLSSTLGPQRPIGAAPRPPARRRHWAWASLATAAALSLWFGLRANGPPVTNVNPRAAPTGHSRQAVTVATNQNVAIMSTTNPDITIMWFYQ